MVSYNVSSTSMMRPNVPVLIKNVWENPPDPVSYAFPRVVDIDMDKLETKLLIVFSGFFGSAFIFVLSYFISHRFVTFHSYLRPKEKVFWCLSFVRAMFGFFVSFFGIWYIAFDDTLQKDVVNGHTQSSYIVVYVSVGFFVFECSALYLSNFVFKTFEPFLSLHHTITLACYSTAAYYGNIHFFAVSGLLLEMTTPFSCFCWMFLKAKMSHLMIWKVNQIVLVHLFHCRTTLEGYLLYKSYTQWDNVSANMPGLAMLMLYTGLLSQLFLLTPYWTYKKMIQLFNPVDWNHPELQKQNIKSAQKLNGDVLDHSKKE